MPSARVFGAILAGAATVSAHGFVDQLIVGGKSFGGYLVNKYPYQSNPPTLAAWSEQQTDLGFIGPTEYTSSDIICHRDAENAGGHVTVQAGEEIFLSWDRWPNGHNGPIFDYMASCGSGNCEDVDMTSLEWFKIDEAGLKDDGSEFWTQTLLENMGWLVKIPEKLQPGAYVLRHEIIALHSAHETNGAQNYPQCFNLVVEGSGSELPAGVPATEFYEADHPGIAVNIYGSFSSYEIPGPAVAEIGGMISAQSRLSASTTVEPTLPGAANATPAPVEEEEEEEEEEEVEEPAAPTTTEEAQITSAPQPTKTAGQGGDNEPIEAPQTTVEADESSEAPVPTRCPYHKEKRHNRRHGRRHA